MFDVEGKNKVLARVGFMIRDGSKIEVDTEIARKVAEGTQHEWHILFGCCQAMQRERLKAERSKALTQNYKRGCKRKKAVARDGQCKPRACDCKWPKDPQRNLKNMGRRMFELSCLLSRWVSILFLRS